MINPQKATDGVHITDEKLLGHSKLSHLVPFKLCHIKSFAYACRMVIGGQSKRTYFFGAEIKALKKTKISYEVHLCVQATVGSSVHTGLLQRPRLQETREANKIFTFCSNIQAVITIN